MLELLWRVDGKTLPTTRIALHRRSLANHVLPRLRIGWSIPVQRCANRLFNGQDLWYRYDRLRLSLHCLLRHDLGSSRLGLHWRNVPLSLPCCRHGLRHLSQLVLELHARILHAVHHR